MTESLMRRPSDAFSQSWKKRVITALSVKQRETYGQTGK
jgi:hypothetical protein